MSSVQDPIAQAGCEAPSATGGAGEVVRPEYSERRSTAERKGWHVSTSTPAFLFELSFIRAAR